MKLRLLLSVLALAFCLQASENAPAKLSPGLYAEIKTREGTLTAELYFQSAPVTVMNFVGLAEGKLGPNKGKPYFDGLVFHRVVPGFVIQGGDPLGTGEGGPGYEIPDEFAAGAHHDQAGVLSMANSGPDTGGSQFFITLKDTTRLNYLHSVFGKVIQGRELLDRIRKGDSMKISILRVGPAAEAFVVTAEAFEAAMKKLPRYAGTPKPGSDSLFDDPNTLLQTEPPRAANFNFKLGNFERATGWRVAARLVKSPPDSLETLAKELKLGKRGALVVHVADRDEWLTWFSPEALEQLPPKAASPSERVDILVKRARALEKRFTEELLANPPEGKPILPAQRIKAKVDGMLDTLLLELEGGR